MTSQEEQMLNSLVERVNSTQLSEKDTDAEELLQRGFAGHPDAVYVLAQTVLVQNIALEQAHAQLAQAQQQVQQLQQQPPKATSFLGGLLGHHDPAPPPAPVYTPPAAPQYQNPPAQNPPFQPVNTGSYPSQPQYSPQYAPPYQGQPYGAPGMQAAPVYVEQPSFLRSAAQTAAGVAAGALAFEGVEALLHGGYGHPGLGMGMGGWGMPGVGFGMGPGIGFGGGGFMGGGLFGGGMGYERPVVEETVINNYIEPSGQGQFEHERREETQFSNAGWDNNAGSQDVSYDRGSNDTYDSDSSAGDSGFGDSGGGDSGGGDGGGF